MSHPCQKSNSCSLLPSFVRTQENPKVRAQDRQRFLLPHLLEDFGLEVGRQLGVDGQHGQGGCILQFFQMFHNLV